MIMLPPIFPKSCPSEGERILFNAFKKDFFFNDWYCFHSYNIKEHKFKLSTEADFLLLGPEGLFCIEVKHTEVTYDGKYWDYGYTTKTESPFEQANTAMYALKNILTKEFNIPFLSKALFGYGVAFTHTDFIQTSPEWDQDVILNYTKMYASPNSGQHKKNFIKDYILRLINTWAEKNPRKKRGFTTDEIDILRDILRPVMPRINSIQPDIYASEQQIIQLTRNQQSAFDQINSTQQIICTGGAGSGKTLIAIANAHLNVENNLKVLLLCFNPALAMYINKQVNDDSNIDVMSVHSLLYRSLKDKRTYREFPNHKNITTSRYIDELPLNFIEDIKSGHKVEQYDVLILDEAQDCMNMNYLNAFSYFIKGGWEEGCWRIFMDPDNQSGFSGAYTTEAYDYLRAKKPAFNDLVDNCRNTEVIANTTKKLTGIDFYKNATIAGTSNDAQAIIIEKNIETSLTEYINKLLNSGTHRSEITILTGLPDLNLSILSKIKSKLPGKPEFLNATTLPIFPFSEMTCSTIGHFKGLENRIILLIEIDEYSAKTLYVAMTRARSHLRFFISKNNKGHFIK